jgi:hypothetical protein
LLRAPGNFGRRVEPDNLRFLNLEMTHVQILWSQSTTDSVLEGVSLSGKRVLVTGVSAGLGLETARALTAHGAEVVGAARDLGKAKATTAGVCAAAANGGSPRAHRARPGVAGERARLRRHADR